MNVNHLIIVTSGYFMISLFLNLSLADGNVTMNGTTNSNISFRNLSNININLLNSVSKNVSNQTQETPKLLTSTKITSPTPVDTTHMGRENVKNLRVPLNISSTISSNVTNNSTIIKEVITGITVSTEKNVPTYVVPEKNDNKKSVPKKGVNCTDLCTNPIVHEDIVKKPLLTEADEDAPYAPSNFVPKTTKNVTKVVSDVPSLDSIAINKNNRDSDYIVPIICVIFSVPLVAILFSFVYKRIGEWWYHRHYRRMDFLIEGMYNN